MVNPLRTNRRMLLGQATDVDTYARGVGLARKFSTGVDFHPLDVPEP